MIGYYAGYKKAHSPEVFNYIQAQIMHGWLNGPRPTWIRDLTGIHAAAGSSVTLDTEALVRVTRLSGGGAITAPAITNVTELAFGGVDECLTVNGTVTLGSSGTVTITDGQFRPEAGVYTLLHTSGLTLEAGNLGGWTVESALSAPSRAFLRVHGDDLELVVVRPGTMIKFR